MPSSFPLASFLLITYNQEKLVAESLKSLLAQTYPSIEIIVADDYSSDNTKFVIKEIVNSYTGSKRIIFNDSTSNKGTCENINQAIKLCQGEMIFIAAGDDISLPNRCEKVMSKWLELEKKPDLIATDAYDLSFDGEILGIKKTSPLQSYKNLQSWISSQPYFFGSSHAWTKRLVNKFPPIDSRVLAEDHIMIFRSIISNGAFTISEPLVKHRRGGVTSKSYQDIETKVDKLKKGFSSNFYYFNQILSDAINHPESHLLKNFINAEVKKNKLAMSLFNDSSLISKLKKCFRPDSISIFFKLRILTYSTFPNLLMPIFWLKKKFKSYED